MSRAARRRPLVVGACALAATGLVLGAVSVPAGAAPAHAAHSTPGELRLLPGDGDGSANPAMVSAPADRPLARPADVAANASDTTVARAHLEQLAPLWGIDGSAESLRAVSASRALPAEPVVRFTQLVDGVPVYGGGLVVALDDSGGLRSVSGDVADDDVSLVFTIGAPAARALARTAAAKAIALPVASLRVGTAFRYAYDAQLVGGSSDTVVPAWRVLVAGARGSDDKVEVLVDARDGHVLRTTGATPHVQHAVCNGNNTWTSDASYGWCGQNTYVASTGWNNVPYVRSDSTAASSTPEVENAYQALVETDAFYSNVLGYDLNAEIAPKNATIGRTNSDGPTLSAIVNYCDPKERYSDDPYDYPGDPTWWAQQLCPMPNAYWYADDLDWNPNGSAPYPGGQMFIGGGLASATDVIAHEMTHGVTAANSNLYYSGESGAINESMSDVFGQLVEDYSNGATSASVDPNWLIGEDIYAPGHGYFHDATRIIGAIRSMGNPALYDQPATMTSKLWESSSSDSGGVHTNSGVGNRTAYLIAHGGSGVTRLDTTSAVGSAAATAKVAHLYWAVQQVLTSNTNYRMLAVKLDQQCRTLAATASFGFTTADCTNSVDAALRATGMSGSSTSVAPNHTSIEYGSSVTISGKVGNARGTGVGGAGIVLQRKLKGSSTWSNVASGTTSSSGKKTWSVKPKRSTYYRTVYAGSGVIAAATAASRRVTVKPTISRSVRSTKVRFHKKLKVTGRVRPVLAGSKVELQRFAKGKWHIVRRDRLSQSSLFSLRYKPTSRAKRSFRVYLPSSTTLGSGVSKKFKVTIT